jgi:hypothetical protein
MRMWTDGLCLSRIFSLCSVYRVSTKQLREGAQRIVVYKSHQGSGYSGSSQPLPVSGDEMSIQLSVNMS